jgi:hypothetical protein
MANYTPKHLGPTRRLARPTLTPWLRDSLAPSLIVVTAVAALAWAIVGHDARTAATIPPSAVVSMPATVTPRTQAGLLPDAGFEAGTRGWRPVAGAQLGRVSPGRTGHWAATLAGGSSASPGMSMPYVATSHASTTYTAELWVRAARPGQRVEVRLFEEVARSRYSVDTIGVVLTDTHWRRLEVTHPAEQPGARLRFELVAPQLDIDERVLVDDVHISSKPIGL